MMKFFSQKNKGRKTLNAVKGFTLVETLVAISIFSVSILGLLSLLASSIANTTYAKDKMIAGYLAQEGIEYIRNMRDNYVLYPTNGTWASFTAKMVACTSGNVCGFNSSFLSTNSSFIFNCSADPNANACKLYLNNGSYNDSSSSGVNSGFVRKIWVTTIGVDEVEIFSEVDWKQGSGNYKIIFSENLFNWTS